MAKKVCIYHLSFKCSFIMNFLKNLRVFVYLKNTIFLATINLGNFQKSTVGNYSSKTFSTRCVCICLFKVDLIANVDPHSSQQWGFSPVCIRICWFKFDFLLKQDPHISQEYGFSPVCIRICSTKCVLCENADPHTLQEYGFSPVCVRICSFKTQLFENADLHNSHG